ncbi:MAG: aminopeptidase [Puniceicoccales bacterium]|jgi:aminopeptidase|nr:aminopeptidase [Puniceicoccales bacterium]
MNYRYKKLADNLTKFSTNLQPNDNVLLDIYEAPHDMVIALLESVRECGAVPLLKMKTNKISRAMNLLCDEHVFQVQADLALQEMKSIQAYIAIRGGNNTFEHSDVPQDKQKLVSKCMKKVLDWRVQKTKWVILRWPSEGFAQQAKMSTEKFEKFYFDVCTMNYASMGPGMEALKNAMQSADRVRIVGNGTDLHFSIKGIPAIACGGECNIPDGEVYTAPVKTSVEGIISYNTPTVYQGIAFENIVLKFEGGKIMDAQASNKTKQLNAILDSDEGARYIGEFAFGFNPHILEPMCDILFDEKIAGSFHFTPGQAYEEADNNNRSQIHWDLVCIQRPEYGGGEIYFDGKLIRKDGLFTLDGLNKLNPKFLLGM